MWIRIVVEWLVIAVCLAVASAWPSLPTVWLAALVVGSRQHALGVLGHWALHRLMPANTLAQWVCLAPMGIDPQKMKRSHWAHHRAISDPVTDPEVSVVRRFPERWGGRYRRRDLVLDALGLHTDEAIFVMSNLMASARSVAVYASLVAGIVVLFGVWAAVVWPVASFTGLMVCHRLRARTEHDHLRQPGITLATPKPGLFARVVYLPHYAWMHLEHHIRPSAKVWANLQP